MEKSKSENIYKIRIKRDITYLDSSRKEKLDLYIPNDIENKKALPGIVYIHGGGWMSGDKTIERGQTICTTIAKQGYVCAFIEYKLTTVDSGSWPQALYDCKTAVQFLRKNADKYNIDPERIGVLGCSAGGHLAAMVGTTGLEDGLEPDGPYKDVSSRVQAIVAMYGIYDMTKFTLKLEDKPWNTKTIPEFFLGVTQRESSELWDLVSPVNHIDKSDPPFLLIHGTADKGVPVQQSIDMNQKLHEVGVSSELILVEGAGHSFDLQPKQKDLRPAVISFLDKQLKNK